LNGPVEISPEIAAIHCAGATLSLEGNEVYILYQNELQREQLARQVSVLRAHRAEVMEWLQEQSTIPPMPPGVCLVRWCLKEPPVDIEVCAVVTEPARFARITLAQLALALADPKRWFGWTIPQLIERLHQVGVDVVLEPDIKVVNPR
jgi:hypothetical protein